METVRTEPVSHHARGSWKRLSDLIAPDNGSNQQPAYLYRFPATWCMPAIKNRPGTSRNPTPKKTKNQNQLPPCALASRYRGHGCSCASLNKTSDR
ncbi:hypothetical protein BaRGS_00034532 [Batillaria attramentaria]|uniref:Uncharacterized protein n=1 Tax=Batillaria attramentaria TaxID=370345 RepID=A0ABD0JHQ5_9CAEN